MEILKKYNKIVLTEEEKSIYSIKDNFDLIELFDDFIHGNCNHDNLIELFDDNWGYNFVW